MIDPDFIEANVWALWGQGEEYQPRIPVDKASLDYPYMPPFVGTEEELEALVAYLSSLAAPAELAAADGGQP